MSRRCSTSWACGYSARFGRCSFRRGANDASREANMVVCAKAMLNVARKLEEDYGTPFFEGSFYGIVDTSAALRDFARVIGDPALTRAHRSASSRARKPSAEAALAPWREQLRGNRVLMFTGGVQILVGCFRVAGSGHDRGRHRHREIDRGRQGAHPGLDGTRREDDLRQ